MAGYRARTGRNMQKGMTRKWIMGLHRPGCDGAEIDGRMLPADRQQRTWEFKVAGEHHHSTTLALDVEGMASLKDGGVDQKRRSLLQLT